MDWTKPNDAISKYFKVKEALWLPQWQRLANDKDGLNKNYQYNLIKLFETMDKVRETVKKPIIVHVAYRPPEYNALIGGATKSAHMTGQACDFHVLGMSCDEVRTLLLPELERLKIRMEDKPGSSWVHIDIKAVVPGGVRFFKP